MALLEIYFGKANNNLDPNSRFLEQASRNNLLFGL